MKLHALILILLFSLLNPTVHGAPVENRLTPAEAAEKVKSGEAILIDVREPAEWTETGVVATAHLLPLSDLRGDRVAWEAFLKENVGRELILYCRSGNRSGQAAQVLAEEGYLTANAGGFPEWVAAAQPLRKVEDPPAEQ